MMIPAILKERLVFGNDAQLHALKCLEEAEKLCENCNGEGQVECPDCDGSGQKDV